MLQNIIGRKREIELIKNCVSSNKPEFIAIYGRRRIGKTYLVKQLLGEKFSFYMTGVYQCTKMKCSLTSARAVVVFRKETGKT